MSEVALTQLKQTHMNLCEIRSGMLQKKLECIKNGIESDIVIKFSGYIL